MPLDEILCLIFSEAGVQNLNPRKRKKQEIKMGHGGTLDSAASGVLGKLNILFFIDATAQNLKSFLTMTCIGRYLCVRRIVGYKGKLGSSFMSLQLHCFINILFVYISLTLLNTFDVCGNV